MPQKEKKTTGKLKGFAMIVIAVLFGILGVWTMIQTWGTKLLYMDVTLGMLCRFYWIPLVVAVVFLVYGISILRKGFKKEPLPEPPVEAANAVEEASEKKDESAQEESAAQS